MPGCDYSHASTHQDFRPEKPRVNRRHFLTQSAIVAGAGIVCAGLARPTKVVSADMPSVPAIPALAGRSTVALTRGNSRRQNITAALNMLRDEISSEIGNRQVVIKPNLVRTDPRLQLGITHVDALRGVLDFLKPVHSGQVIIAENTAGPDDTLTGFRNLGYASLPDEYNCRLADLKDFGASPVHILDPEFRPRPINISQMMIAPDTYIISLAIPKVHNLAGATLSVKNMTLGAPVSNHNEKVKMHPQVDIPGWKQRSPRDPNFNKMFHYNMFRVAHYARPSLAILDAFEGMERRGPTGGDPVPLHAAVAGADWIAADRVAADLMDIPFHDIGHLHFCAEAQMGHGDLEHIAVLGERIAAVKKPFVRCENHDELIVW